MVFTPKEAMKLVRQRAGFNYNKSAKAVLFEMVKATYRGKTAVLDISAITLKTSIVTVLKWAGVTSVRQGERILNDLSNVVTIRDRVKGNIFYTLDLTWLANAEPSVKVLTKTLEDRNAERAARARAQRAALREESGRTWMMSDILSLVRKTWPRPENFTILNTDSVLKTCVTTT